MTIPRFHARYDIVIVGGGSAGCVLARRLSDQSRLRVLLCEAGGDIVPGREPADILDAYPGSAYLNRSYLWNDLRVRTQATGPESGMSRLRGYEQARVLGGGSSINGQFANRGAPDDYDRWQAAGAKGWGWTDVLPYFRRLERDIDFDGPLHGDAGPIVISRVPRDQWPGHATAVSKAFTAAGFDFIADQNGPFREGWFPIAISNAEGRRVSTATAYLTHEVRARSNLHIRKESSVRGLMMDGTRCIGVELDSPGGLERIGAGEVIVCAGAIHSPAILMRSGIGPERSLRASGIDVVANRPGVGQHLMDHPAVALASHIEPGARSRGITRRHMLVGLRYSSGYADSLDGDMFVFGVSKSAWHAVGDQIGALLVFVNQTFSHGGSVELRSPDWRVEPDVRFNLLADPRDAHRLAHGFRRIAMMQLSSELSAVCNSPFPASYNEKVRQAGDITAWNRMRTAVAAALMDLHPRVRDRMLERFVVGDFRLDQLLTDDAALDDFIRRDSIGLWHASCTCRMGDVSDPMSVTDPDGRVYGVTGLRVADASVFPLVPRGNTNIPTIMVAEKIADAIVAAHANPSS